jgi:hypothetical protein
MQTIERGKGLWNTRLPVADAISFHDPVRCKTFTQMVVTEGGKPYVIGTRLYMNAGRVIRVAWSPTQATGCSTPTPI